MNTSKIKIHLLLSISLLTACAAPATTAIPPSAIPTLAPIVAPTTVPTPVPTMAPTIAPTVAPTATQAPTPAATDIPLPTKVPLPTGEPAAVAALTGVYANFITLADMQPIRGLNADDCSFTGSYTLTLSADSWKVDQSLPAGVKTGCFRQNFVKGGAVVYGSSRITFMDAFDLGNIANCPGTHAYNWTMVGSKLTLQTATDKCPLSLTVFSTHPWTKLKP